MGIRSHGNKVSTYMTNPKYSAGKNERPVAGGKEGVSTPKVGNKAGLKEAMGRSGDPKGAPAFKQGGRV